MMKKAKYNIGQKVVATVSKRGSYEPSWCSVGEIMTVDSIERRPDGNYTYVCSMDGYRFAEDEIMTTREYGKKYR